MKYEPNQKYTYVTNGDKKISIDFMGFLNGGGTWASTRFINVIQKYYPNKSFQKCLEWCSGPGFIGFELLSNNICSELSFMDIYQPALDNITDTIKNNGLTDKIILHNVGKLSELPREKYDLIVGNPPWHKKAPARFAVKDGKYNSDFIRRNVDENLTIHKEFFNNVGDFLTDNGVVIVSALDNRYDDPSHIGVSIHDFYTMAKHSPLKLIDAYYPDRDFSKGYSNTYYCIFEKRDVR